MWQSFTSLAYAITAPLRHTADCIVLPFWTGPDGEAFYDWIYSGRVHPFQHADPYALTGAGLVETGYEFSNFIVYEALDDGWLRIRIKPGANGEVWTHVCHLEIGASKLSYNGWESFLKEHGDWMRVTVEQPDRTCSSKPEPEAGGSTHDGWVKWRDEEDGPWVWVYTRGC